MSTNNCLDNNVVSMTAYWKRMSHQRDVYNIRPGTLNINQLEWNPMFKDNNLPERNGNRRYSLLEEHREIINPLTKHWRKSLRVWEHLENPSIRYQKLLKAGKSLPPKTDKKVKKAATYLIYYGYIKTVFLSLN